MKLSDTLLVLLVLSPLPSQEARPQRDAETRPHAPDSIARKEREFIQSLLDELTETTDGIKKAYTKAANVRKVLKVIDDGRVTATDAAKVQVNRQLRGRLVREMRALRATAETVRRKVNGRLQPRQRGLLSKLRARHGLEERPRHKKKISEMVARQAQEIAETEDHLRVLDSRIQAVGALIQVLENQMDFLELSQEAIEMGSRLNDSLEQLNQEMSKVIEEAARQNTKQ